METTPKSRLTVTDIIDSTIEGKPLKGGLWTGRICRIIPSRRLLFLITIYDYIKDMASELDGTPDPVQRLSTKPIGGCMLSLKGVFSTKEAKALVAILEGLMVLREGNHISQSSFEKIRTELLLLEYLFFDATKINYRKKLEFKKQGRPNDDAFDILLFSLVRNYKYRKLRPDYRLISGFLREQNISMLGDDDIGREFRRLNETALKQRYNLYREHFLEWGPGTDEDKTVVYTPLPDWDAVLTPSKEPTYSPF